MEGQPGPRLEDEPGEPARLEIERLRRQLAEAGAQLELVTRELEASSGRIAHDLQAVMQVTEGFAAALQRSAAGKLSDKERHYLERIVDTSARGNRLVNDLMGFARLGVRPIKFAPVALEDVLRRARQAIAADARERSVEWSVGELPTVWGDAELLEQVLVHLLGNAFKYTRGRASAQVRVEASLSGEACEVRIIDNGMGFDPEFADRLFRPFERLHGTEAPEGNGMGLANVKRIVERHGGTVRAEGRPGAGATFAFTVPALAAEAPREPEDQLSAQEKAGALRVLVVDDDPMVLLSLRNMLEIDGHQVSTAAGGQIGVDAFEQELRAGRAFDVVVTDFGMPHMDGREVARLVKQARPGTVVILLTGWQRLEGMVDWKADVDSILSKPPRLAQLREALTRARAR
jgi:CheY-like chemotaxis protein